MIKYIIDRFENDWAIIETSEDPIITFKLPKNLLPREAKEGDVLNISFTINKEETLKRKNAIQIKLNSLKKQDKGNDITL
jgi:hypothetical protein